MNIIEFTEILKQPKSINRNQTADLEDILEEFPYFQAAHFLHLNGLKKQSSFKYNIALKKTAAFTTDRTVLFDYIASNEFDFEVFEVLEEDKTHPKTASQSNPEVEQITPSKKETETKETNENPKAKEPILPIGKPLQFSADEKHSFNEWLQISKIKPIARSDSDHSNKSKKDKTLKNIDLIDKFIASNPKISPINSQLVGSISNDSITENQNLMTETLAHVYLEQKKYKKAITAFQILSLKYPEKSSFFANQIKEAEKLL